MSPIPFLDLAAAHEPLAAELRSLFDRTLAGSAFVGGAEVAAFETEFAEACGSRHAIGVANGTDALELVLRAAGIGPGDEVIVPANTFVATAEAVVLAGATPVFADVDPDTLLLTPDDAEAARSHRTAAVMAVHLYGQMVDTPALRGWAERHGLALIEDAAQAHRARFADDRAGSAGLAAGFSFYPGKNLGALGDGGAVTTDDDALAATIRTLANHGRAGGHHAHDLVGRNSRLDGLQAGALRCKLRHLDAGNDARRARWADYVDRLAGLPGVAPVATRPEADCVHHLAVIQVGGRDALRQALARADIGSGVHYPVPCHRQPAFAPWAPDHPLPVSEAAADRIVSLPMYPELDPAAVDRVVEVVAGHLERS